MDFSRTIDMIAGFDDSIMEIEHLRSTTEADEDRLTELTEQLKERLTPLIRARAAIKRKLTLLIKSVIGLENVSSGTIKSTLISFDEYMNEIKIYGNKIDELYLSQEFIELNAVQHEEEQINSALYKVKMEELRAEISSQLPSITPSTSTPAPSAEGAVGGAVLGVLEKPSFLPSNVGAFRVKLTGTFSGCFNPSSKTSSDIVQIFRGLLNSCIFWDT